jgi:DNA-binding response OmpR family regulator
LQPSCVVGNTFHNLAIKSCTRSPLYTKNDKEATPSGGHRKGDSISAAFFVVLLSFPLSAFHFLMKIEAMHHLLLVDDDPLLRRSLTFQLQKADFTVTAVGTAGDALTALATHTPDLVLLDIGLPDVDGMELLRRFRESTSIPVIFVTARVAELDEVLGLEMGADDYITKPFTNEKLLARIRSVLRRVAPKENGNPPAKTRFLTVGDLTIDPIAHVVTLRGTRIDLPPRVFDLLYALMERAGRIVTAEELLNEVWGEDFDGEPQVIYVHVRWLREKIENDPNKPTRLLTIRGVGYKLNST